MDGRARRTGLDLALALCWCGDCRAIARIRGAMLKSLVRSGVAAAVVGWASPATAAGYQITDLGVLSYALCSGVPPPGGFSFATALNNRGQVAGGACVLVDFSYVLHAFSWTLGV